MISRETAAEIGKEIEKFNDARLINKFISLTTWYSFNYNGKSPCGSCKFIKGLIDFFCSILIKLPLQILSVTFKITVDKIIINFIFYLNF